MASTLGMRPNHLLVIFLIVSVALSGCLGGGDEEPEVNETEQVSVTQNDGLTLTFRSYADTYAEGEPVVLELNMENTGQREASDIAVSLFGASFIAGEQPRFSGRTNLAGVDLSANREGESTTVEWQIPNPVDLEEGVTETFPAGVRAKYQYQTTGRGAFTIVPNQNFDGESSPITTQTTAGPLDVSFDISTPKPVRSEDGATTAISVPLRITNNGDGQVADINGDPQPVHVLRAEFPNSDKASLECPPTASLFEGTRRIICTAHVPTDIFQQQLSVRVDLGYDYFETQDTSFRVEGVPGDQSAR